MSIGDRRARLERYAVRTKPYVRWWWFAEPIRGEDVEAQLDWIAARGFGGVEIAWVYPYTDRPPKDTPVWLGEDWQAAVTAAARGCVDRDLGCDFTFGTLWPFGGSWVPREDASRTVCGISAQRLRDTWEAAHGVKESYIVDHLDGDAIRRYGRHVLEALLPAIRVAESGGTPCALFSDSWEVEPEGLWRKDFAAAFESRFGYSISPYVGELDRNPGPASDYFRLRSDYVLGEFFDAFGEICDSVGAVSRVQCHGAPADLVAAYAAVDVPESEAMLFDPEFSTIAASAAAQADQPVVSAEAFTCLYGWKPRPGPAPRIRQERAEDVKLVGDALFAAGVNHIVWHGMPYNPPGESRTFYATTHVGVEGSLAPWLNDLNEYFAGCAADLRGGRSAARVAVYLPLEDAAAAGALPPELKRPSAAYHWEMQYQRFPEALWGYRPIWTSERFLVDAEVDPDGIHLGSCTVNALYVDVTLLSVAVLSAIESIARRGGRVLLARTPSPAGGGDCRVFEQTVERLRSHQSCLPVEDLSSVQPIVRSSSDVELPSYWAVDRGDATRFFFAHPGCNALRYPLDPSRAYADETALLDVTFFTANGPQEVRLTFRPRESLTVDVADTVTVVPRRQPTV